MIFIMSFMIGLFRSPGNKRSLSVLLKGISVPLLCCAGLVFLYSCEQETTSVGKELMPNSDYIEIRGIDTISTIVAYTCAPDSISTLSPSVSYIGSVYDPYFGTITADFVSQVKLGSSWESNKIDKFTIDSVSLFFSFLSMEGDTAGPHYLSISEIDERLYSDSSVVYFSNREVSHTGFSVSNILLPKISGGGRTHNVKVNLPISFGQYLMRDPDKLFYSTKKDADTLDFNDFMYGLHFQITSPKKPVMFSLSIDAISIFDTYSNYIVVYLKDSEGRSVSYPFYLDAMSENASYNRFLFDYSTVDPQKSKINIGSAYSDTVVYIQRMYGTYARFQIPGLKDFKDYLQDNNIGNVAVNKARLSIPYFTDGDIYTDENLPLSASVRYITTDEERFAVSLDYIVDGKPDTVNHVYNFNVAAFMQSYINNEKLPDSKLTGEEQPVFELYLSSSNRNNLILKTAESSTPPTFSFSYSLY